MIFNCKWKRIVASQRLRASAWEMANGKCQAISCHNFEPVCTLLADRLPPVHVNRSCSCSCNSQFAICCCWHNFYGKRLSNAIEWMRSANRRSATAIHGHCISLNLSVSLSRSFSCSRSRSSHCRSLTAAFSLTSKFTRQLEANATRHVTNWTNWRNSNYFKLLIMKFFIYLFQFSNNWKHLQKQLNIFNYYKLWQQQQKENNNKKLWFSFW